MTGLVERSRAVRKAVYVEAGHINDWSAHDHMVADCADETATEIERLQARNELLEKVVEAAKMVHGMDSISPGECAVCDALAALKEQP